VAQLIRLDRLLWCDTAVLAVLAIVVVLVEIAVLAVLAGLGGGCLVRSEFCQGWIFWISGSPYITLTPAQKKL
jgi:hypothetical protein